MGVVERFAAAVAEKTDGRDGIGLSEKGRKCEDNGRAGASTQNPGHEF